MKNFMVHYDASHNGLGTIGMQKEKIHKAQVEAFEKKNVKDENLHGMDKEFETHLDGTLYIRSKSWLPRFRDLREMTMYEPYKSNYSIHSGSDKIHHNLK
ncbi:hypothetical protein Tco_0953742 [Tanacetum coccineum]|uniref:Reverse transcriptase domain-containing protein n=1 Tax=Tanacetum coccineum TaxID=301880 RepID=A0ABQ5E0Q7_9ASTR